MTRLPVVATLAAALVLAVGGGLLLMRPTQQPGVGTPTPSPSFSPSPSASAIPTTLRARWMGGNRPLVAANAGSSILFADGYFEQTQSNEQDTKFLASSASADGEGRSGSTRTPIYLPPPASAASAHPADAAGVRSGPS
jgi:hypothetical protein